MARGDDIEERLIDFAVRVIRVSEVLPDTPAGQHIKGQLLRSGTSPAPNYGEARSAESARDFIHKLKIVVKDLNETRIWIKITIRSKLLPADRLEAFA
jgi:four helix bundle protein